MDVPPLDEAAMAAASPRGVLGRLDGLALWLSGVQGVTPPRPLARRTLLVLGDPSALASDITVLPVTDGSFERGVALAGTEVDAGADVLLLAGPGNAAALVCALTGAEPHETVGGDDAAWMREVAAVRDALRRSRAATLEPLEAVAALGPEPVALMAGVVAGAARRRTPVVVDGTLATAAVLVAAAFAPASAAYVAVADRSPDPAQRRALAPLGLDPLLGLGIGVADGTAALLALRLLDAAALLAGVPC